MPNIIVQIPFGSYVGPSRQRLVQALNQAALCAEQIPDRPGTRSLCWVLIQELDEGQFTCGGADISGHSMPCLAQIFVPHGVLDEPALARYAALVYGAFEGARPVDVRWIPVVSTLFCEVPDQRWGVNGQIWGVADFARAAGYRHLQG